MHAEPGPARAVPALFKALFLLFTLLVLAAAGYAGWIVVRYWGETGV